MIICVLILFVCMSRGERGQGRGWLEAVRLYWPHRLALGGVWTYQCTNNMILSLGL